MGNRKLTWDQVGTRPWGSEHRLILRRDVLYREPCASAGVCDTGAGGYPVPSGKAAWCAGHQRHGPAAGFPCLSARPIWENPAMPEKHSRDPALIYIHSLRLPPGEGARSSRRGSSPPTLSFPDTVEALFTQVLLFPSATLAANCSGSVGVSPHPRNLHSTSLRMAEGEEG